MYLVPILYLPVIVDEVYLFLDIALNKNNFQLLITHILLATWYILSRTHCCTCCTLLSAVYLVFVS